MRTEPTTLLGCLESFREQVNGNTRLKSLLKEWNPNIVVETTGGGASFTLQVRDLQIQDVQPGKVEIGHTITIQAEPETLKKVFTGSLNPAQAVLEGDMAVFGSEKDQVKLDAISLVVWGL